MANEYDFIEEKIVPQRFKKLRKFLVKAATALALAIIFGTAAGACFYYVNRSLAEEEKEGESIVEEPPADDAVKIEEAGDDGAAEDENTTGAESSDTDSGSISLGGVDIRDIPLNEYNKKIAYVSQDNFLFDLSVRENIRLGDQSATDKDVEEAARKCGCHDFIMGLEKGYDTVVGTSGGHLSGGERQRIAIARAMLKNADIIILDEATAYTDPENEALIQRSVASLVKGKTLIVIAHRLSTVKNADRLYVISDGNIEEQGTHDELLAKNGLYSSMWTAHISVKDGENDV